MVNVEVQTVEQNDKLVQQLLNSINRLQDSTLVIASKRDELFFGNYQYLDDNSKKEALKSFLSLGGTVGFSIFSSYSFVNTLSNGKSPVYFIMGLAATIISANIYSKSSYKDDYSQHNMEINKFNSELKQFDDLLLDLNKAYCELEKRLAVECNDLEVLYSHYDALKTRLSFINMKNYRPMNPIEEARDLANRLAEYNSIESTIKVFEKKLDMLEKENLQKELADVGDERVLPDRFLAKKFVG